MPVEKYIFPSREEVAGSQKESHRRIGCICLRGDESSIRITRTLWEEKVGTGSSGRIFPTRISAVRHKGGGTSKSLICYGLPAISGSV